MNNNNSIFCIGYTEQDSFCEKHNCFLNNGTPNGAMGRFEIFSIKDDAYMGVVDIYEDRD